MVCYKLSFPFWFTTACIAVATNCMSSGSWPHFQSNDYLLLAQLKLSTGKNFKRYNDYYISNTWKRFLWTASGSKSQAADIRVVFNIFHVYFGHAIVIYIACFPWTERTTIKTNDCTQAKERQRSCSYEQYSSLWRDSFRTTCIPSDRRIIETFHEIYVWVEWDVPKCLRMIDDNSLTSPFALKTSYGLGFVFT